MTGYNFKGTCEAFCMLLILRFSSVSKTCYTLISQSSFILSHLQASLSNNTPFLLFLEFSQQISDRDYFLLYDNDGFDKFKQLQLPVFPCVTNIEVVDSCNGLICLMFHHNDFNFVLWNPLVQKYISLPQPSITEDVGFDFGFGFDSKTNDYKILMIGAEIEVGSWFQPYLFSLNQNCWKRLSSTPNDNFESGGGILILVNGAVHWLGNNARNYHVFTNVILGFDFSAEEFMLINLPESLIGLPPFALSVMKYRESSIAVMRNRACDWLVELWAMKEYGVVESWTKLFAFEGVVRGPLSYKPELKILGFRNNGDVLLEVDDGELVSLDLNGQQMESPEVYFKKRYSRHYFLCGTHVESLVLLDKAVDVHNQSHVRTGP